LAPTLNGGEDEDEVEADGGEDEDRELRARPRRARRDCSFETLPTSEGKLWAVCSFTPPCTLKAGSKTEAVPTMKTGAKNEQMNGSLSRVISISWLIKSQSKH
jgi:hypothetical protein